MKLYTNPDRSNWDELCQRPHFSWEEIADKVRPVLKEVKKSGDHAIINYTEQWDGVKLSDLEVTKSEIQEAIQSLDVELKQAIDVAARNIKAFHLLQ